MNIIETTLIFDEWLDNLKDLRAKIQIATRIRRAENGNFGDRQQADIAKAAELSAQIK